MKSDKRRAIISKYMRHFILSIKHTSHTNDRSVKLYYEVMESILLEEYTSLIYEYLASIDKDQLDFSDLNSYGTNKYGYSVHNLSQAILDARKHM